MKVVSKVRKSPRVAKLLFTELTPFTEGGAQGTPSMGRTMNLSEGGILLEIPHTMPFDIPINIALGIEDDVVRLTGKLAHYHKKDDGSLEIGVEFVNPTENDLALIRKVI
ncbi:MAG: PilZ domain-containing protein [Nitrospinota bacterium]|nr:PilZ domain-containing protein [Nitrospinota bacterium]